MSGEKILIIEDEADIASMVDTVMRDRGYRTIIAYDGVSGLEMALEERPQLILLDLRLPQMSGVELLARLDKHQFSVPVVVVTALGSEELALHALRMGVKDYVKKPFDLPELLQVVERALGEGRLRRERDILTDQLLTFNQQLKQRVGQLTALYEVAQALASTLDLDELLNLILREACRVLNVRLTSIFLIDEKTEELVFRLGTGGGAEHLVGKRLAPGQGIAGWVAQHGEPLLIGEVQSDKRFSTKFDGITGFTTETILAVPLMVKGRVIGVLEALNKQEGFNEDDLALLRSLATSAAVAIENTQLFKETKRRLRESEVLFRLGKQLTALLPLRELLQIVVKGAIQLVPKVERSILYFRDPSSGALRAGASSTSKLSAWDVIWEPTLKRRVLGRALRENRTVVAHIHPGAEAEGDPADFLNPPYSLILAVPLRVQEEDLGVLLAATRASADFTTEDKNLLTTFANQAAIAIKNNRLHRQTQAQLAQTTRAYGEIRALQETTTALLSSLDLQDVLEQIVDSLISGLGYRVALLADYNEKNNTLPIRAIATDPGLVEAGRALQGLRAVEITVTPHHDDNLAVRAALTKKIEVTDQLHELFRPWVTSDAAREIQSAAGVATLATIPLRAKGRLVGNLFAGSGKDQLSRTDLDSLQTLANHAAIAIENARLYQNLRESRDQVAQRGAEMETLLSKLVRLQRIALALGKLTIGVDLRDVYKRLTEHAATLLEVKSSAILLFDPERQELVCQEPAYGVSSELIRDYRIPLSPSSPAWEAWQDGRPLIINDVADSPLVDLLGLRALVRERKLRATMFSILRMGGRSMGAFQVSDKLDGSDFTSDDQRVLEIFASQSAIAIENARLFTREKRRASEMETLVEIAQAVTEAVTERPKALLERIVRGACEALRADCAVVYPFVATEPDTYDVANVAAFGTLHPLQPGPGVTTDDPVRIVRKNNPFVCEDIARDRPALLQDPFFERESIRAFVGVLLEADEEELGVLYVNFRSPHHFQERELTSVRLIAHQAALAIAKSRLFETLNRDLFRTNADLMRKLNEMAELQKITNMINSTLEIDRVFDSILQGAMSITGAPQANILMVDEESGTVVSHMRKGDQIITENIDPRTITARPKADQGEAVTLIPDTDDLGADETLWSSIHRHLISETRSFMYVPILSGGEQKRIGLLGIGSSRAGEFDPDDRRLLEALANQAAIAIQNARYVQTVREYQERQVEAERIAAIADVAGNMVHRINNMVGAIRPLIQQVEIKLERDQLDEHYLKEKLRGIRESADRTLDVARQIRRPFQSVPLQPIDVNASIAAAWTELKTPVGVEVEIQYGEDLPPVRATPQLDEVFRNLMKNALDAMSQEGGLLSVRSQARNNRQIEVVVQDTGPGIPEEIREKIFHMGTTTKPGGTGYGLWWSRMFLRRLEGDIHLQDNGEPGCTFTVTLPIIER